MLTDSQTVEFLKMIKSGNNTYGKLQERFSLDRHDWFLYIDNDFRINALAKKYKIGIIEFVAAPKQYNRDYQFNDNDVFKLTVAGQNILDKNSLDAKMRVVAIMAAIGSVIAAIYAALSKY